VSNVLFTDLYELTMMAGYVNEGRADTEATFDLFFRKPPNDAENRGAQAHSWVMSFSHEIEAFRAYARTFPDHCILLVDRTAHWEVGYRTRSWSRKSWLRRATAWAGYARLRQPRATRRPCPPDA
jgi:nicotinic acid phosphoribosyltransferase